MNGQAGHGTHAVQGRRWPKLKGDRLEWPVDHRLVVLERTDAHGSSSFAFAVRNHCPPWRSRVSAGSPRGVRVHLMPHPRASRPHAGRLRHPHPCEEGGGTRGDRPEKPCVQGAGRVLSQEVHASFGSIGAAGGPGRRRIRFLSVGPRLCFTLPPEELGSEPRLRIRRRRAAALRSSFTAKGAECGACTAGPTVGDARQSEQGESHGSTPPTPPRIRVRTRRFGGVERLGCTGLAAGPPGRRALGHSGSARAMRASVPSCPALRDSPFASGSKASFDWMFRRPARMSGSACRLCPSFGPSSASRRPCPLPSSAPR